MCFKITSIKPPKKTVAYKLVTSKRKSPYWPDSKTTYKVGSVVSIGKKANVVNNVGSESEAGIYVYLNKKDAVGALKCWNREDEPKYLVIELEVDPADFIARGYVDWEKKKPVATYRKVKVLS